MAIKIRISVLIGVITINLTIDKTEKAVKKLSFFI